MFDSLRRFIFGNPLSIHEAEEHKLGVPLGLAVFSSDALSSTAYATEEILIALVGTNFSGSITRIPLTVAIAIIGLIGLVIFSYRQVINAYPQGGGSYIVAKENLGKMPSLLAAASLLIDYILTVSVSTCAGVAAITSTGFIPHSLSVNLCIIFILFIMIINLRGLKESGLTFSFPVYLFLISMIVLIVMGFIKAIDGGFELHTILPNSSSLEPEGHGLTKLAFLLLFLKAFSHGCSGLTGIEAVADGVKAFKNPSSRNANHTMLTMAFFLSTIFLGITILAIAFNIHPMHGETVLSQIAKATFGQATFPYYVVQISTTLILVLAANTAFADFPRVANFLAADGYLPRQLANIGDRLVFNNGIAALGVISILLVILYRGDTHALIPLYAVGVFISFTTSQLGMVFHHLKNKGRNWKVGLLINLLGAVVTSIVAVIIMVEKFMEGAWILLLAIPLLIWIFLKIKEHYNQFVEQTRVTNAQEYLDIKDNKVLVLVSSLSKGSFQSVQYAQSISKNIEAVHIEFNQEATERFKKEWAEVYPDTKVTILTSPFRSLIRPLVQYIEEQKIENPHTWLTVIIPEFVTHELWHNVLHNQTAMLLKAFLRYKKGVVVTTVRFFLDD